MSELPATEAVLPGPTTDRLIVAGIVKAICQMEAPKKRRRFLEELEAVADAYEELGNVVRLRGVCPQALGASRRGAATWLRANVQMCRVQFSRLIAG